MKQPSIEPLHDRVLVERIPEPQGRIIVPDVARENSKKAKVLAVGPGKWVDGVFTKTAVKPGDIVLIPGAGNTYPDWEKRDTILIQEGDIGGIFG